MLRERDSPEGDAPDEHVPEQVEELQQDERGEHLVLHPPDQPHTVLGGPPLRRFPASEIK